MIGEKIDEIIDEKSANNGDNKSTGAETGMNDDNFKATFEKH
jgi:hypothetical protein